MDHREITLVEVLLVDEEPCNEAVRETETFWVTETIFLRVPVDVSPELVAAVVDAICAC